MFVNTARQMKIKRVDISCDILIYCTRLPYMYITLRVSLIRVLYSPENKKGYADVMWGKLTASHRNSNSTEISSNSHLDSDRLIATIVYMAQQLCCRCMCKKFAIWWPATELGQGEVSIEVQLWAKKTLVKRSTFPLDVRICKWARLLWIS